MPSNAFPTPFNINRIQAIPGPAGDRGSNGPPGVGNGLDVTSAPFSADPTGSTDSSSAFANASAAAASDPSRTVYVPAGTYKHSTTATISGNLHFAPGAVLKPDSGQTITITGDIQAGERQQIFDLSLGGSVIPVCQQLFHVGWWGAIGDGVNDDTAAIQAAIDAIPIYSPGTHTGPTKNSGTVVIPPGKHVITKPLLLNKYSMHLMGAGPYATRLQRGNGFAGPMLVMAPDYALNLPLDTSLVTGPGQSLKMDPTRGSGNEYMIALKDFPHLNLDGVSAFTVEFFTKIDPSNTAGTILKSGATLRPGVAGDQMFYMNFNGSPGGPYALQTRITTSSGNVTTISGNLATSFNANQVYHIAMTYDGTNIKFWVDGVLDSTIASSGTLVQQFFENMNLGYAADAFPEVGFTSPFAGWIDSVRFSNSVRYTTGFTKPTAKFVKDSSTLLLMNFDRSYHQCIIGQASGSHDGIADMDVYFVTRPKPNDFGALVYGNVEVEALGLDCDGLCPAGFITFSPGTHLHDLSVDFCPRGFNFWNNCFESFCRNIIMTIGVPGNTSIGGTFRTAGDYGFVFSLSGIMELANCQVTSGAVPIANSSAAVVASNFTWVSTATAQMAFYDGIDSASTVTGYFLDDETPSSIWLAGIMLAGSYRTIFTGCAFDLGLAGNTPPIIYNGNTSLDKRFCNSVFVGCQLAPASGGSLGFSDDVQTGQTQLIACQQTGPFAGVAWNGTKFYPNVDGVTFREITSGSSSTAGNFDQVVSLKVAGVYNLTTPPAPIQGQQLIVKDHQGDAGTNTKTITANAGQTIDGAATATITTNRGRLSLCFDGVSDWMS